MEKANSAEPRPYGFVAIGVFFAFGAAMAGYAAVTLLVPGSWLDVLWRLNQRGHAGLLALGRAGAALFILLSVALVAAAVGWFGRRRWAWLMSVAIIATNVVGDAVNVVYGREPKATIGVVVAGLLLLYLTRRRVREYFQC